MFRNYVGFDIKFQQLSAGGKCPEAKKLKNSLSGHQELNWRWEKDTQFFTTDVCRVVLS